LANDGSEIRTIEAQIYRCSVDEPFGYAKGFITVRESAVVRLVTADGTVGWGEAFAPAGATAAAIETVGPGFIDRSVFERVTVVTEHLTQCRDGLPSAPTAAALSAIALASLDAAGQLLSRPAWTLLGGVANPPLRVYASALWFRQNSDPTAHYGDALREAQNEGFTAVKAKIGLGVDDDVETIRRLGAATNGMAVMVDANQAYGAHDAGIVAGVAGDTGVFWLEEPLPPDRLEDYAALRTTSMVPIAAGETVTSVPHARRWLDAKATDIFQPDVCLVGGLESAAVITELAEGAGVVLAPHCFGLGIGLAASLHWAAAIAAVRGSERPTWLEVDTSPNPARDALLADASWFLAGGPAITLPDEPGLGVPDLRRIAEFRVR
jgi:D-galactarolactone cycloisomerase